jgi:ankyrin repeat protein
VELLLAHGVDPDGQGTRHPALRGRRPIERALDHGAQRNVELLRAAGARPPATDAVDDLLAAAARGDRDAVDRALDGDPGLAARVIERHPRALIDAAERGNVAGVELLARLGYDVNLRDGQAALHLAAYYDNREVCELLIELGADPAIRDTSFDAPAAGWAHHAHHDELAAWLEERSS